MNEKGFYFLFVLITLAIVLCFSQVAFGEETCPCKKDTAEFMIPVDDDTFKVGIVFHPISSSDKLSKSTAVAGTFDFVGFLRCDKDGNWHDMKNGFAYRDDIVIAARTLNVGTVDGDSWFVDLVLPDGRISTWPTLTYYKNYGDQENCYVCSYWTHCDVVAGMFIDWIGYGTCLPTGIYTFRFYQNGSIVHSESFEMKEIQFDHFALWFDKDTLAYGEKTSIYARADDANNEVVPLCPDARIDLSLDENGALYGNLIGPYGERGKSLTDVPYILAAAVLVKYAVDGEDPNGPKEITISVSNGDGVSGSGSALVVDSILFTLEIPEPREVWPDLPPGSGGNPGDRHKKQNILVTLKKNLKPVEG